MKTQQIIELYPVKSEDYAQICNIMLETLNTLLKRTDGVRIEVSRDDQFPKLNGKNLITGLKIETWDIAA